MSQAWIGVGIVVFVLFLLASGHRSQKRHEQWRREHGFPPTDRKGRDQ